MSRLVGKKKNYWSCWLLASFQITQKILNQRYPILIIQASRRLSQNPDYLLII